MNITVLLQFDPETGVYQLFDENGKVWSQGSLNDEPTLARDIKTMEGISF